MTVQSATVYYIRNVRSGTVIDLKGGSAVPGTNTQGWPKRPLSDPWVAAQLWVIHKGGNPGTYTIQNKMGGTYLDLTEKKDGTPVEGFGFHGGPDQQWVITQVPGQSYYTIKNFAYDTYVDIENGNPAPGTKVQGWTGAPGNPNQQWYFDPATN